MAYQDRGKYFSDLEIGDKFYTAARTITETDVVNFAGLSGDFNPLHTNKEFMDKSSFKGRIAHGVLSLAVTTGLVNQLGLFEGTTVAVLEMVTKFTGAVMFDDTINVVLEVLEKKETSKPHIGIATFKLNVLNQNEKQVFEGTWKIMLKNR